MQIHTRLLPVAAIALLAVGGVLAACGGTSAASLPTGAAPGEPWAGVESSARGETVEFWLYGGDQRINAYLDGPVATRLRVLGVTLHRVPIDDTTSAIQRLVAQHRAGATKGAIDLVWVNGANFAAAKAAGLWAPGWAATLPNARLLDPADGSLTRDFGVAVDGDEAPWSRAAFVLAYDSARTARPPATFEELAAYEPSGEGTHLFLKFEKRGLTTDAAVRVITKALGIQMRDVGIAGMKDKAAVTTQWVSVPAPPKSPECEKASRSGKFLRWSGLTLPCSLNQWSGTRSAMSAGSFGQGRSSLS